MMQLSSELDDPSNLPRWEVYQALSMIEDLRHGFTLREPHLDLSGADKDEALRRLHSNHQSLINHLTSPLSNHSELARNGKTPAVLGDQIHGNALAVIRQEDWENWCLASPAPIPGVDGLLTNQHGVVLGIHVADCAAVWIIDRASPAFGIVHSGKKGTELEITLLAIQRMQEEFGCIPVNLTVHLSPCIRPPHYEKDFAAQIVEQAARAGVPREHIHDPKICTATHVDRYYSYRKEMGKTGRMLAAAVRIR